MQRLKKAELAKVNKRKNLHEKQVEYAREVKQSFLPKLKSQYDTRKLKMGVHRSHNVEAYLAKVAKERINANPLKKYSEEDKRTPVRYRDVSRNSTHTNDDAAERNSHQKNTRINRSRYEEDEGYPERASAQKINPQLQENFMFGEAINSHNYVNSQGESPNYNERNNLDFGLQGKKIKDRVHSSVVSEPNIDSSSHQTPNKRSSLVKGYGDEHESGHWKDELQQDQAELKKKISGMLDEIKKMEQHVKHKEEKILKEIEQK